MNVRDADSLLRFHRRGMNQYAFVVPYPEAAFFREHARALSAVIGVNRTSVFVEGEGKPVESSFVTANFFSELGGGARHWGGCSPWVAMTRRAPSRPSC